MAMRRRAKTDSSSAFHNAALDFLTVTLICIMTVIGSNSTPSVNEIVDTKEESGEGAVISELAAVVKVTESSLSIDDIPISEKNMIHRLKEIGAYEAYVTCDQRVKMKRCIEVLATLERTNEIFASLVLPEIGG